MRRWKRLGAALGSFAVVLMLILSMPAVGGSLVRSLIQHNPLDLSGGTGNAQAIVVLTGGNYRDAPEYGRDVASGASVSRGRYAAFLHKKTGLPIMVVGGKPIPSALSEGEAMENLIEEEFHVPVRWVETQAKDTEDSAFSSFKMLNRDGIANILLVTDASHMRRAELAYSKVGFKVIPAPINFIGVEKISVRSFLPSAGALSSSTLALNEWFGIAWGKIKGTFRS